MNYRHAFHAGNFADVVKHAMLVRILCHLRRKPAPFRVIDTHAGLGRYDLAGPEAGRTLEWQEGVGRLTDALPPPAEELIEPYRRILAETRERYGASAYPGSPAIIRELLRPDDRAIFVEKHPEDAAVVAGRYNVVRNAKVLALDGWTALGALVPPRERRGLVLIDPPYEEPDELTRSVERLSRAVGKWPTGIFVLWYPIKDLRGTDAFAVALAGAIDRPILRVELLVDRPSVRTRLNGCGLAVVNPPWTLAEEAGRLLEALAPRLARRGFADFRCDLLGAESPVG